jgi:hypothetical protein
VDPQKRLGANMTVANTSIEAYDEHKAAGKVGAQAHMILGILNSDQNYSRREIAKVAGIELSSVCGRVNELLAVGLLVEDPKRKCSVTGKTINPVRTRKDDDTNSNLSLF